MKRNRQSLASNVAVAFVLTVSLFALWGLGHRLYDAVIPQFAAALGLRGWKFTLAHNVYGFAYFLGAIPAALYARRFGYKAAIILGLGSVCLGAFVLYPAAVTREFPYFLLAVTALSCGWIVLEVAANPLAASLGTVETAVRRLNIAQSFYPFGALAGVFAGRWVATHNIALPAVRSVYTVLHPYILIGVGIMALAFLIEDTQFPSIATEGIKDLKSAVRELRTLLSRPLFAFGVAAQFFGVLGMAATWSLSEQFSAAAFRSISPLALSDVLIWSLAVFAAGRLAGTALMYRYEPDLLLTAFACGGLVFVGAAAFVNWPLGTILLIASNFFLSITWPTILGVSIRGLGPLMKLGTALICMGGAFGGVAYELIASVWDSQSLYGAPLVPVLCYGAMLAFAVAVYRAGHSAKPADTAKIAPRRV